MVVSLYLKFWVLDIRSYKFCQVLTDFVNVTFQVIILRTFLFIKRPISFTLKPFPCDCFTICDKTCGLAEYNISL